MLTQTWSSEKLQDAMQRCVDMYAELANSMFAGCNIPVPVNISFDLGETNYKAAGEAIGFDKLEFNMILYEDNVEECLNQVAAHEVAHLAISSIFYTRGIVVTGHGPEWRELMRRLGKPPDRYHKFDVTRAKEFMKEFKKKVQE
jgi:predicted SprT family Zn-dependent metalloprotease